MHTGCEGRRLVTCVKAKRLHGIIVHGLRLRREKESMWLKVVGGLMDHGVLSANCSLARDAPRFLDDDDVQRQEQTLGINILFYGRKGLQHEHASALRIPPAGSCVYIEKVGLGM